MSLFLYKIEWNMHGYWSNFTQSRHYTFIGLSSMQWINSVCPWCYNLKHDGTPQIEKIIFHRPSGILLLSLDFFKIFHVANQGPRSWERSRLKVTTWVQHSVDLHPLRSMSIGHPIPELRLFRNLTLKIKGQDHGWGHSPKSQCV